MNLVERVKNILITPKTEWNVIDGETTSMSALITGYALPLALIPAAATFLGVMFWTIGFGIMWAVMSAVISLIGSIFSVVVGTYAIDLLAPSFNSEKNMGKSAQLAVYSSTAVWVAGILGIIPFLGWLGMIAGAVYSIYLMYLGVGPLKKTAEDKKVVYLLVTFVIIAAVYAIIKIVFGALILATLFGTAMHLAG